MKLSDIISKLDKDSRIKIKAALKSTLNASQTLGIMNVKDLEKLFPVLAKGYKSVYGVKHPDIKVTVDKVYHFRQDEYSMGSWDIIFIYKDGKVIEVKSGDSRFAGKSVPINPGEMLLNCTTGNLNSCTLYVHESNVQKFLPPSDKEVSKDEKAVLKVFRAYKPFARKENYYREKYGLDYNDDMRSKPKEYDELVKSLIQKGYIQISSDGKTQLTKQGKNLAVTL